MKNKLYMLLFVLITILSVGCNSSSGQSVVLEPDPKVDDGVKYITMRAVEADGSSRIEIPLLVFGDSVEVMEGATLDIEVNGFTRNTSIVVKDYYVDVINRAAFYMQGLADGDEVVFVVTIALPSAQPADTEGTDTSAGDNTNPLDATIIMTDGETPTNDETAASENMVELTFSGTLSTATDTVAVLEVTEEGDDTEAVDALQTEDDTDVTGSNVTITPIF
ncbi:MAG: hypothetical protein HQM16_03715 [Deltaproteobacteria bacterium]|nr:hypothetical protein [Deltaproteobacteria bacterium]